MDTITHGIVGALAGKAFFAGKDEPANFDMGELAAATSSPTAKAAIVACTLGSMFPDIDIFAGPLTRNPLAIMEWHRNITHSLIALPIWSLLLASLSVPLARRLRWKLPSYPALAGIYAAGILSHIFLDGATSFGTMMWSPLKYTRVAWDWLFIIDFTFSGIALVPQFAAWCYRQPENFIRRARAVWIFLSLCAWGVYKFAEIAGYGFPLWVVGAASLIIAALLYVPRLGGVGFGWTRSVWCRTAFAVLCVYLAFAAISHQRALKYTATFAAAHHLQVESIATLPLPPTLTHWAGVVTTPSGLWRTTFVVPEGRLESAQLYAEADSSRYITEAKSLRDVQIYLWFARFPIWQVEQVHGETIAEVTDVRFFRRNFELWDNASPQPNEKMATNANSPGFTFQIVFDASGRIISHGFKQPE